MGTELNVSTKIVEAGTAEITVVLGPQPALTPPVPPSERHQDQVIDLGSAMLAPGLATRLSA